MDVKSIPKVKNVHTKTVNVIIVEPLAILPLYGAIPQITPDPCPHLDKIQGLIHLIETGLIQFLVETIQMSPTIFLDQNLHQSNG